VYFTTSHFKGYAAVLARLDRISVGELDEVVTEAWLAPRRSGRWRRFSPEQGTRSTPGIVVPSDDDEVPSLGRAARSRRHKDIRTEP
jgi:hypothetical protein